MTKEKLEKIEKPSKDKSLEENLKLQKESKIAKAKLGRLAQQQYAETLTKTLGHIVPPEELEQYMIALDPHNLRNTTDEQIVNQFNEEFPTEDSE